MHEAESSQHAKLLNQNLDINVKQRLISRKLKAAERIGSLFSSAYLGVDEQKVHLQECEQGLQDRMSENNVCHALAFHCGVHGDFQSIEYQSGQSEN